MFQKILIYDSDLEGIDELNTSLSEHGFKIEAHNNPEETKRNLESDNIDLFIICLHNKSVEPHRLLDEFKANKTDIPFVFAMDYDDNMTIAHHYDEALCFHDTRYSNLDDTVKTILNALHHIHKNSEVHERISSAYDKIKKAIPLIIDSGKPILVVGEKGTGKSYFAQELHNRYLMIRRPVCHGARIPVSKKILRPNCSGLRIRPETQPSAIIAAYWNRLREVCSSLTVVT